MTALPNAATRSDDGSDDAPSLHNVSASIGAYRCISEQTLQRSSGRIDLAFKHEAGQTRLERAFQGGCGKIRLPRQADVPFPSGVVINTAGGLTGGDDFSTSVHLDAHTRATVTTQAAEKVYRSAGGEAVIENRLSIGSGARLDWLPQETILFDRGALRRKTIVEMAADATLTATELLVFGRTAMGETVTTGSLSDQWRVHRDGRLVFADATRVSGPVAEILSQPAATAGGTALALVLHIAPDAEERVEALRAGLDRATDVRAGTSAFDGMSITRIVAPSSQILRKAVLAAMACLRDGLPPPRPWLI